MPSKARRTEPRAPARRTAGTPSRPPEVAPRRAEGADEIVVAYVDGGARGNPGPAGYGVRVTGADGRLIAHLHAPVGIATNNVAEYAGLLAALRFLRDHGYRRAVIRSDSELLVRQMRGDYRVRHPRLKPLYAEAQTLAASFEQLAIEHVPREANLDADRLANLAMDEAERIEASR